MNIVHDEIRQLKKQLKKESAALRQQLDKTKDLFPANRNPLWLKQIADSLLKEEDLKTKGAKSITITNITTQKKETISLNPKLSIEKNAALYAKKAAKAAAVAEEYYTVIKPLEVQLSLLEKASERLTYLDSRSTPDEIAETISDIRQLLGTDLADTNRKRLQSSPPFRHYHRKEWELFAGKTEHDNDELSIKFARPNDIWFHAANVPGSHLIIRRPAGKPTPPADVISAAASLAAWFSKARNAPLAEVHYTEARHVSKRKGAPPGEVCIQRFKSIKVPPLSPEQLFS